MACRPWSISQFLGNMLFGISATDLTTFAAVLVILGVMALIASYIPAFRATRIDRMTALRQ